RLNHPNIVQIYDFGCVDSVYYLAMEFVDGHSLGTYLKRGHFSETESIQIIRHACRALSIAHADGIVHRDIKPDNLMLTSRGDVKLVDLGIAKRIDEDQSLTQTGQAIGTPHYISPEQIRGQKDVDARADVYSLGATLYHLVTGHTPYSGASGPIVMSMHLVEPLPDPRRFEAGLSEDICRVIRRMMAKDRDARYGDVYALDLDLYRLQCGEMPRPDEKQGTAVEPRGGRTASPGYVPAAGGSFDSGVLNRIEESLASAVGPMAKVLVRKTARTAPTLEALCGTLAEQIAETTARDKFLAKCLLAARTPSRSSRPGFTAPAPPSEAPTEVRGAGPSASSGPARTLSQGASFGAGSAERSLVLSEQDLQFVETELARHVGPLARILVKRAAKGEGNMSHVITKLELEIDSEEDRRAFREAVRKGLR
ncbi:MAG TPA: serine/threonine-protein kinase, partial [Thermoanaerobaculia bacterium]